MPQKHIITIAGRPGSGKSTTARLIAQKLGYEHFSPGDMFRQIGKERGVDVLQANLNAEEETEGIPEIDFLVDERLRQIGLKENNKVVDSRTAWHWIPDSFKVFLDLDLVTAAERILAKEDKSRLNTEDMRQEPVAYAEVLKKRLDSETRRYKKIYDIDPYDMSNYNLVVDTAKNNIEQVVELVLKEYEGWLKS